jgi:Short C-terminal domain
MLAAEFNVVQVFFSFLWFFLFVMWIMLVFQVFVDIVRSPDLSGVAKALWVIFAVLLPYLGVLTYLIVRGGKMHEHQVTAARRDEAVVRDYIRDAARSPGDDLVQLADLRERGVIDDDEFARMKARIIG